MPPLAGFFGKLYVFLAAIEAELFTLAIIGVLSSVVGSFYYLRIIKIMYFDDERDAFDMPVGRSLSAIMTIASVVTVLFLIILTPVLDGASLAAASLFSG